jgi:hypothetical protein
MSELPSSGSEIKRLMRGALTLFGRRTEIRQHDQTPDGFTVEDAVRQYDILYGAAPLTIQQRADLEVSKEDRQRNLVQSGIAATDPTTQTLHLTAFLQDKALREQEALAYRRPGIASRLIGLVLPDGSTVKKRDISGDFKTGDTHKDWRLQFQSDEDGTINLTGFHLDWRDNRPDDPFAKLDLVYSPANILSEIVLDQTINSYASQIEALFPNNPDGRAARDFVHRFSYRPSYGHGQEDPGPMVTTIHLQVPSFSIRQVENKGLMQTKTGYFASDYKYHQIESKFVFNPADNILHRNWAPADVEYATSRRLSKEEELKPEDYLSIIRGILSLIPRQNLMTIPG